MTKEEAYKWLFKIAAVIGMSVFLAGIVTDHVNLTKDVEEMREQLDDVTRSHERLKGYIQYQNYWRENE